MNLSGEQRETTSERPRRTLGARIAIIVAIVAGLALAVISFAVASTINQHGPVAATVNGEPIYESQISDYIASYREQTGLDDDAYWAYFLKQHGYSGADMRDQIVKYYAKRLVIQQDARRQGVSVTSAEIDDAVNTTRQQNGLARDAAWNNALAQMGYTEAGYRNAVGYNLLEHKLYVKMGFENAPQDALVYVSGLYDSASIVINPMPSGLAYDVDTDNISIDASQYAARMSAKSCTTCLGVLAPTD